jgi:hypothetical protein
MHENIFGEYADVPDDIEGMNRRLDEIGNLLQSQLAQEGVTQLDPAGYNPTPFEYATLPQDGGHMALPYGETTFDFENGVVTNEHAGEMYEIRSFEEMSKGLDSDIQSLRSIYIYGDVVGKIKLDDGDWFQFDSCQYVPIKSQGFKRVSVTCSIPWNVYGVASTRAQAFTETDSISLHMTRQGELDLGQHDTWQTVPHVPHGLKHDYGMEYAKGGLHMISLPRKTFTIENNSGNGNAIDVRVLGAATHERNFHEITRTTGLADGDHHIFHVEQSHHIMIVQVRNSTDGNDVSVYTEVCGGAP